MSVLVDVNFRLNGVERRASVPADISVLEMLRDRLDLTGTKYACGEGECGACTIVVDGITVNSCLMFAVDCDGRDVTMIEGLASNPSSEALRASFVARGAVQCGFCTPGLMMQASQVLRKDPHLSRADIQRGIEGNLCRCTGYRKIIDAIDEARLATE